MNEIVHTAFQPENLATMSSKEIAELLECRHDNVRRTIERLAERGVIALPPTEDVQETGGNNRTYVTQEYRVGKRDSYVIVAQLSPEFTARLVDRWQELEAKARDPMVALNDPATMRHLLLGYTEKVIALESKVEELEPKAQALDAISASDGAVTFTQAAKIIGVKRDVLTRRMNAMGWVYRQNNSWVAYQQHIQNGRLEYKEANYTDEKTGLKCSKPYCHITPKGLAKLAELLSGGRA
ncbi:MAG: DNA-binding protein [Sphingomonadales bacterium]|nr:MAG: DNA-binding protein [Sphingomonadales bacterium]